MRSGADKGSSLTHRLLAVINWGQLITALHLCVVICHCWTAIPADRVRNPEAQQPIMVSRLPSSLLARPLCFFFVYTGSRIFIAGPRVVWLALFSHAPPLWGFFFFFEHNQPGRWGWPLLRQDSLLPAASLKSALKGKGGADRRVATCQSGESWSQNISHVLAGGRCQRAAFAELITSTHPHLEGSNWSLLTVVCVFQR